MTEETPAAPLTLAEAVDKLAAVSARYAEASDNLADLGEVLHQAAVAQYEQAENYTRAGDVISKVLADLIAGYINGEEAQKRLAPYV